MLDDAREEARRFFDELWAQGDYWALESDPHEQARYDRYLALLAGRSYERALEIGAGAAAFTRELAPLVGELVALEVSTNAVERGHAIGVPANVDYRQTNVVDVDLVAEGPWDLVVFAETISMLGWLHTVFDVFWLASQLHEATRPGGLLLLANTHMGKTVLDERLIRTYHDLFRNAGFDTVHEEAFAGQKNGIDIEALITLFEKPSRPVTAT